MLHKDCSSGIPKSRKFSNPEIPEFCDVFLTCYRGAGGEYQALGVKARVHWKQVDVAALRSDRSCSPGMRQLLTARDGRGCTKKVQCSDCPCGPGNPVICEWGSGHTGEVGRCG